jgi:hypothetical protein
LKLDFASSNSTVLFIIREEIWVEKKIDWIKSRR